MTTVASPSCAKELGLSRNSDGYDSHGTCCQNTWAVYRDLRSTVRARIASMDRVSAMQIVDSPCRYGAPLVSTALQRLDVLATPIEPASVTPSGLPSLPLRHPAVFGRPVTIRGL